VEVRVLAEMSQKRAQPVRTCVGCRGRDRREALVRFAVRTDPPGLAPDIRGQLGGRGVSVHPDGACIDAAVRRGGFARAMRGPVPFDARQLCRMLADQYARRGEGLLLAAGRSRKIALGTDAVRESIRQREVSLLVVAGDASNRREELVQAAEDLGSRCVVFGNRASLGRLFGRDEVAVLAVLDTRIAEELARAAARVSALSEDE
jgi:hypothetical protein